MANWAVVIGINKYWESDACLGGAVRDALKMMEWLLNKKGGNVPARNLKLCLSPTERDKIPRNIQYADATQQDIFDAILLVEMEYGGRGEKFFFYYAGHGVNYLSQSPDASAIVPTDLRPGAAGRFNTNIMLSLSSIVSYLKKLKFEHQFFFIDACRNIPLSKEFWNGQFNPGGMPGQEVGIGDSVFPERNQYILYATSSGFSSIEWRKPYEGGIFTDSLLKGLGDKGNEAKVYNYALDKYKVTVSSLFEYVKREVESKKEQAGEKWEDVIQVPVWRIQGNENPELAIFDANSFDDVDLNVDLDPTLVSGAEIYVYTADQIKDQKKRSGRAPVKFSLKPRDYGIVAIAPNHVPVVPRDAVNLWEPMLKTIKMKPKEATRSIEDEDIILPLKSRGTVRGIRRKASLTVRCRDPVAPLEIADSSGKTLRVGSGSIYIELPPGDYQARLIDQKGRAVSVQKVVLTAGAVDKIELIPPPSPLEAGAIGGELIKGAELGDPIANPELSTILALAGTASTFARNEWSAGHLRSIGGTSFADAAPRASAGLQVLFTFDSKDTLQAVEYVRKVKLRFWRLGGSPSEALNVMPFSIVPGLAGYSQPSGPGPYCLSVELPDQKPIVFYLGLLPGRLALVVFQQTANGQIHVFQYMPKVRNHDARIEARFTRQLELLQRFYVSGRLDHAYQNAIDMLHAKWEDPVAGCVGGYLMLRLGKPDELDVASDNMTRYYDQLCDSHILRGEFYAHQGINAQAKEHFAKAIDIGIPIFADGLALLSKALRKYKINHKQVSFLQDVLDNRVRGLLWSAKQ